MVMSQIITRVRPRTSGPNPTLVDRGLPLTRPTYSGVTVNPDTALGLSAVYRSIVLISTAIASQPIDIFQRQEDGSAKNIEPEALRFLWDRPNPEMTKMTFWEVVIGHEVMGDGFIWVGQNEDDDPVELWPVDSRRMKVGRNSERRKVYVLDNELPMMDFASGGEIIHIPNWGQDGLRGVNPIKVAPIAVSLGLSAQEYADRFFSQDATPGGLISVEGTITPEQADEKSRQWAAHHADLRNKFRPAVLGNGAKFSRITISPEEAQLIDERRFQLGEIARLFGLPPHLLGDTERSTSWGTGIEEQTLGFIMFTLAAHMIRVEQAMDDAILRRGETRRFMKFNINALLRGTALRRAQMHAIAYGRWKTANEIRRDEELPPVEGGDDLLAAQNLVPLEDLGLAQGGGERPAGQPPDLPASARRNGGRA